MVRDYIAELINGLKTGSTAHKDTIVLPYSKMIDAVLELLKTQGFVLEIKKVGKPIVKFAEVKLNPAMPVVGARRVSKFSRRVYRGSKEILANSRIKGLYVLTTPLGILTHRQAREKNVGGEVLFKIW